MPIEGPVHPALNAALERIEYQGRKHDGKHQAGFAHRLRHRVVYPDGDECDSANVAADNQPGRQHVGYAPLENQVRIHQPVANDRPAECEWQKNKRKAGQISQSTVGMQIEQKRNCVEKCERQHRQQRAPRHPLQLLAQQRSIGLPVTAQEQQRGQPVWSSRCLSKPVAMRV